MQCIAVHESCCVGCMAQINVYLSNVAATLYLFNVLFNTQLYTQNVS